MSTSLHSTLNDLAASFADSILAAIRGASLHELVSSERPAKASARSPRPAAAAVAAAPTSAKRVRSAGRLPRRSAEDIGAALTQVVALVKKHKDGMRAEQIRSELGLQAKEMPRILKEGLGKKSLKAKGQKRATTYFCQLDPRESKGALALSRPGGRAGARREAQRRDRAAQQSHGTGS